MPLFHKEKNKGQPGGQPRERNEIHNKALKETLANTALSTLQEGQQYGSLAGITVTFGYLFDIEGHGLEALFKIITDKGTYYFAAQKSSILVLEFDEELFAGVTNRFLELHA